jgi:hypothetical protein
MKSFALAIVAVLLLVGGGLIERYIDRKPDLGSQLAASEAHAATLEKQVQALLNSQASFEAEVATLESRLSAARTPPVRSTASKVPAEGATPPPSAPETEGTAGAKPFAALSQMMKNPAMREMAKKQQAAMQDMAYGDLYTALRFNDEDKAYFKQLLTARADAETELGFRLMDSSLTPEARQAALDESKQQKEQSNANIRDFLDNDSDYRVFEHYEQTKAQRMMLMMNKGAFDAEPLTPEQESQLIDTMHDVATRSGNTANSADASKSAAFDPSQFTQAALDQQLQKLDRDAQAVSSAAAAFLSPRQ